MQTRQLNPLTRVSLRAGSSEQKLHEITGAYPDAATCICLEAPLLTASPPVSSGLWNQNLLLTGLRATTQPEDTASHDLLPEVTLENVLVEFSPLEFTYREGPDDVNRTPYQWRSLWLVRDSDSFWMTLFVTDEPGGELFINVMRIEYSRADHAFFVVNGDRSPLVEQLEAKPFFVTLALLRDLSLSIKPESCLAFRFSLEDRERRGLLAVRGPAAKLERPKRDTQDLRLHFVRYLHSGARYEGPPSLEEVSPAALLELDLSEPFSSLSGLDAVYARVRKAELNSGHTLHMPEPEATGRSEAALETMRQLFPKELD